MTTRLDKVIEQVKDARKGQNRPWIFDDNGNIKDNVMCCEVLDILEELKEYEIPVTDEWIENFLNNPKVEGDNTYNAGCNISNDLNMNYLKADDGQEIILFMVHLFGDIRWGYSDYFAVKFDSEYDLWELESVTQLKDVNDTMVATINAFSELYNVYDHENGKDVGEYYYIELEDLLEEIKNDYN